MKQLRSALDISGVPAALEALSDARVEALQGLMVQKHFVMDFPGQAFGPGFSLSMPSLGNIVICQATVIEMIYTFTVYLLWFYVVF